MKHLLTARQRLSAAQALDQMARAIAAIAMLLALCAALARAF